MSQSWSNKVYHKRHLSWTVRIIVIHYIHAKCISQFGWYDKTTWSYGLHSWFRNKLSWAIPVIKEYARLSSWWLWLQKEYPSEYSNKTCLVFNIHMFDNQLPWATNLWFAIVTMAIGTYKEMDAVTGPVEFPHKVPFMRKSFLFYAMTSSWNRAYQASCCNNDTQIRY